MFPLRSDVYNRSSVLSLLWPQAPSLLYTSERIGKIYLFSCIQPFWWKKKVNQPTKKPVHQKIRWLTKVIIWWPISYLVRSKYIFFKGYISTPIYTFTSKLIPQFSHPKCRKSPNSVAFKMILKFNPQHTRCIFCMYTLVKTRVVRYYDTHNNIILVTSMYIHRTH